MARKQNKAERQARLATPKAPPPTLTRDQLYEIAKEHGIPGASKLNKTQLVAALAQHDVPLVAVVPRAPGRGSPEEKQLEATRIAQAAEVHQARLTDPHAPQADGDRGNRLKLGRVEQAALKEWQLGGEKGPRPDTPNYDYIAAQYVAGGAKSAKRTRKARASAGGATKLPLTAPSSRGQEALAARKALGNKAPAFDVAMTDAELDALIAEVHVAYPDSSWLDEYRYARFIDRRGVTRGRWEAAWERLFPPGAEPEADEPDEDPVIENPTAEAVAEVLDAEVVSETVKKRPVKNPPAKKVPAKAPAKKQPAKKATKQVTPRFKQGGKK